MWKFALYSWNSASGRSGRSETGATTDGELAVIGMMIVYVVLDAVAAIARSTKQPRALEYVAALLLAACATSGVLDAIVFPNLAFGEWEPLVLAVVAGCALAARAPVKAI